MRRNSTTRTDWERYNCFDYGECTGRQFRKISNESFTSSHNYELIADDPVCEEIDTLMTNDDMTLQQKADRVASLFLRSGRKNSVLSTTEIEKHRISYLNHVGLFSGSLVVSWDSACQEIENSRYIKTSSPDQPFIGVVEYVGLDLQFGKSQHLKLRELGLSYELTFPDVGAVSPHMLGYTLISSPDEFSTLAKIGKFFSQKFYLIG